MTTSPEPSQRAISDQRIVAFRATVLERGGELYRDLPWRRTRDPYEIWISEVMLQQTQTTRVDGRWQRWLERFPTIGALAASSPAEVLEEWQGLGYNRRALALLRAAREVAEAGGAMPEGERELTALPGIGPATAAGIRAFPLTCTPFTLRPTCARSFSTSSSRGRRGCPTARSRPWSA